MNSIINRLTSPTPTFFRKLRNIGIALAAAGGAILAAPVAMPAIIVTIGGYLVAAGGVITAVSQATTENDDLKEFPNGVIIDKNSRDGRE